MYGRRDVVGGQAGGSAADAAVDGAGIGGGNMCGWWPAHRLSGYEEECVTVPMAPGRNGNGTLLLAFDGVVQCCCDCDGG